jgi:hypothetical protein
MTGLRRGLALALLALLPALAFSDEVPPAPAPAPCAASAVPHSSSGSCSGGAAHGTECEFACERGYLAIGRHVCQSYTTEGGSSPIVNEYFGGRCERLCAASAGPCLGGTVPVRLNSTEPGDSSVGRPCFATRCMEPDAALRQLARGAYSLWNLGRNPATGITVGRVDPSADAASQGDHAHIGINGVALIMECVAAEMGWITRAEAQQRVQLSLTALAGELPGFTLKRQQSHGWIPTFFNATSGSAEGRGGKHTDGTGYTTLDSGLNSAGVLFAKTYFEGTADRDRGVAGGAEATASIVRLGAKIFHLVRFEHLLCDPESRCDSIIISGVVTKERFRSM